MTNDNGGKISKREQHVRYAVMLLEAGVLAIVGYAKDTPKNSSL